MDTHGKEITADLARAARALAQVSAGHLASQARLDEQLVCATSSTAGPA